MPKRGGRRRGTKKINYQIKQALLSYHNSLTLLAKLQKHFVSITSLKILKIIISQNAANAITKF